ncbi:alpha 1,2 mannosyltransferase [Coemansia javaensis]|uniref:Mannosyltransferase n=1 Tax=Coemansia javaensis TaxID=2761396 RepID=A0A9W8HC99_9FUNG|nr:alpha 1,2 mannosyltransferase [Coemansia javaensis]
MMWRGSPALAALLALRVLLAGSPAYIHPDEFFQAPEVAAGAVLGVEALRTWEFAGPAPVRSVGPIWLYAAPPMAALRLWRRWSGARLTPWALLWAARAWMVAVSLAVDACVVRTVRRAHPPAAARATALLLASSHCLAVLCCRPFANAFATAVLAACLDLLSLIHARRARRWWAAPALGAALALGTFSHVTFAAFGAPVGAAGAALLWRRRRRRWRALAALAGGGAAAAAALVAADSLYYGRVPTLPLLNNARYNADRANLAAHGLHPRWLHAAVSLPTLFGPLLLLAAAGAWRHARGPPRAADRGSRAADRGSRDYVAAAAAASVATGLAVLSAVPHQEPRFLAPALPGLVVATARWHRAAPRRFWVAWAAFNAACALVFGVVHQAGVVPALAFVARTSALDAVRCHAAPALPDAVCRPAAAADLAAAGSAGPRVHTAVLLVSTFMAPRHLLAQPADKDARAARVELHDLVGMDAAQIRHALAAAPAANCTLQRQAAAAAADLVVRQTQPGRFDRTLVVAPASADMARIAPPGAGYDLVPLYSYAPHVNFDHLPAVLRSPRRRARLCVYALQQAKRDRCRQRVTRLREHESTAERLQRLETERMRAAARRRNESPTEREERRLKGRLRAMKRRSCETEEERTRRREQNRTRMAQRRRAQKEQAALRTSMPPPVHAPAPAPASIGLGIDADVAALRSISAPLSAPLGVPHMCAPAACGDRWPAALPVPGGPQPGSISLPLAAAPMLPPPPPPPPPHPQPVTAASALAAVQAAAAAAAAASMSHHHHPLAHGLPRPAVPAPYIPHQQLATAFTALLPHYTHCQGRPLLGSAALALAALAHPPASLQPARHSGPGQPEGPFSGPAARQLP